MYNVVQTRYKNILQHYLLRLPTPKPRALLRRYLFVYCDNLVDDARQV